MGTSDILTAPIINGTPTGNGLPVITLKKGSGTANYTTTSTSYEDVDTSNLSYSVTIPVGWELAIIARMTVQNSVATGFVGAALTDGATVINEAKTACDTPTGQYPLALLWSITGDGEVHYIRLQFKVFGAVTGTMNNSSSSELPTMLFILIPAN